MSTENGETIFGGRLPPLARLLVMAASAIIILAGMKAAAEIVAPTLFAIFLAILVSPLLHNLERRGFSTSRALALLAFGAIAIVAGIIALIYFSISRVFSPSPATTNVTIAATESSLAGLGINATSLLPASILSDKFALQATIAILQAVGSIVVQLILLVALFVFFLLALPRLRQHDLAEYVASHPISGPLLAIRKEIIDFVVIRTKVNFFTAIPAVIFLFVAGIDFALLWGVLLFIFSFIPYIGFALATIPPAILGWLEYGPVGALAVVAVFLAINFVAEYVLFPRYAGRGLNLPPYVVLLSVVFWGWLLGALGALIAVPITLLIRLLLSNFVEARWLVDLLGGVDATPP
jgi:predicted PurR-regulated permease PerM